MTNAHPDNYKSSSNRRGKRGTHAAARQRHALRNNAALYLRTVLELLAWAPELLKPGPR